MMSLMKPIIDYKADYYNDHEENNICSLTPISPDLIYEIEDTLGMIGENAWDHP